MNVGTILKVAGQGRAIRRQVAGPSGPRIEGGMNFRRDAEKLLIGR